MLCRELPAVAAFLYVYVRGCDNPKLSQRRCNEVVMLWSCGPGESTSLGVQHSLKRYGRDRDVRFEAKGAWSTLGCTDAID